MYLALVFAEMASDVFSVSWLPEPLRGFVEARWNDTTVTEEQVLLVLLSVGALSLMLVSIVGLWFFWRPARMLYTAFLLVLACAVAASGSIVQTALTSVLSFMNTIIAGVILAMIYFSPLREDFEPPSADAPP